MLKVAGPQPNTAESLERGMIVSQGPCYKPNFLFNEVAVKVCIQTSCLKDLSSLGHSNCFGDLIWN
jgi:hypothetical protein